MSRSPSARYRQRPQRSTRGFTIQGAIAEWRARKPVLVFVSLFVLIVAAYYAISRMDWYQHGVFPAYLSALAHLSGWILNLFGAGVTVTGDLIASAIGSVSIKQGCDATEPILFLVASIVAFPSPWRGKIRGLAIGLPLLFVVNIVRILSLYEAQVHKPEWFDVLHVQIWQPFFILLVVGIWAAWAMSLSRARALTPQSDGSKPSESS